MNILNVLFLSSLLLTQTACDNDSSEDIIKEESPETNPGVNTITYEKDVKTIIDNNCIACHANPPQRGAPMSLITFADVKNRSGAISDRMKDENNPMPKSGLLDATVVKVVDDWIAGGLKEK